MTAAIAFYRAVLGESGESVVPTRYYFNCGGVILAIVDPSEHGQRFRPNPGNIYFAVSDLDAALARAVKAGATALTDDPDFAWGIHTQPWGERSFYVRDPFGNPLCFVDERTLFTGSIRLK